MSGRDWQPGDVAMLMGERIAVVDDQGRFVYGVGEFANALPRSASARSARPLVVIDAEDREQVERLTEAWLGAFYDKSGETHLNKVEAMQAALREFANPTLPEPEGIGAVVQDDVGELLVRVPLASNEERWFNRDNGEWYAWSDLNAVRVLSEGVTQ